MLSSDRRSRQDHRPTREHRRVRRVGRRATRASLPSAERASSSTRRTPAWRKSSGTTSSRAHSAHAGKPDEPTRRRRHSAVAASVVCRQPRVSRAGAALLDAIVARPGLVGVATFASAGDFASGVREAPGGEHTGPRNHSSGVSQACANVAEAVPPGGAPQPDDPPLARPVAPRRLAHGREASVGADPGSATASKAARARDSGR
jgi:hypothetical protein